MARVHLLVFIIASMPLATALCVPTALLASRVLAATSPLVLAARRPVMRAPIDGLQGVDMQRRLGELTFSELTSELPVLGSITPPRASLEPGAAVVGLYYGQLSRGEMAGTRVYLSWGIGVDFGLRGDLRPRL